MSAGDSLVGRVLDDRYQVIERIGRGGHGTVYRGLHLQLEREVAIKVMAAPGEGVERRFRREAKAQARLRHPAVVKLLDFGRDHDGNPYMVQEFVDGEVLTARLKRGVPPLDETVSLVGDVLDALAEAHALGLVHRDVKPANIMVARGPRRIEARLLDFGVVKLLDPDSHTRLTRAGALVGTPGYMAPEQVALLPVTPATDLYSVGVVLYQMLAGRRPYGGTLKELLRAQLHDDPAPLPPTVHGGLGAVALQAMAREPSERFPSAEVMADALLAAVHGARRPSFTARPSTGPLGGGPPHTRPSSVPPPGPLDVDEQASLTGMPTPTSGPAFGPPPSLSGGAPPSGSWSAEVATGPIDLATAPPRRRASLGWVAALALMLAVATAGLTSWMTGEASDGPTHRVAAGTRPADVPPQAVAPVVSTPPPATPTLPVVQVPDAPDAAPPADEAPDEPAPAAEPEPTAPSADRAPPRRTTRRTRRPAPVAEPDPPAPPPAVEPAPDPRIIMGRRLEAEIADAFDACRCDDALTLVERLARIDPASARLRRSAHRRRCRLALPGNCVTGDHR